MNPTLTAIEHWMAHHHRVVRFRPVTSLSVFGRLDTIEEISKATRELAKAINVDASSGSFFRATDNSNISPPIVLAALSALQVQVGAAYHTFGLAAAFAGGVYEYTNRSLPKGATKHHDPDFDKVIAQIYDTP